MSITDELMECIKTAAWSYEDGMGSRHVLHIYADELADIAQRIRKAAKDAVDKAHADGERNAVKQVRSRSEDYRKGYAAGAEAEKEITGKLLRALENDYGLHAEWDGLRRFWTTERSSMENIDGGTEVERIEGSGITEELREWAHGFNGPWKRNGEALLAIADRIDERHRAKAERLESYRAAVDAMLKEYVKLPLDADGVPIHMGDVMEWSNGSFTVHELKLTEDGWQTWDSEHGYTVLADERICHVQPDSWERIIGDAMGAFLSDDSPAEPTMAELVERCRRLADGQGR